MFDLVDVFVLSVACCLHHESIENQLFNLDVRFWAKSGPKFGQNWAILVSKWTNRHKYVTYKYPFMLHFGSVSQNVQNVL